MENTSSEPVNAENNTAVDNDENLEKSKRLLLLDSPLKVLKKRDLMLCIGSKLGQLEIESDSVSSSQTEVTGPETAVEPIFLENEESEESSSISPRKRSSSIKGSRSRSYPSSPGLQKAVRFADTLGLDLAYVKNITNTEDPPEIPKSALIDLHLSKSPSTEFDDEELTSFSACSLILVQKFVLPSNSADVLKQVCISKVMLESCELDNETMQVTGIVRVSNVAYHKSVFVHYSLNNWLTEDELQATYVSNSCDGPTDKFSFTISLPGYFEEGMTLQFALMYSAGGMTFWDSHCGSNYVIECQAKRD